MSQNGFPQGAVRGNDRRREGRIEQHAARRGREGMDTGLVINLIMSNRPLTLLSYKCQAHFDDNKPP